ncbi:hypothetical protein DID88_008455 [Monilinia fructigena]|uniref:Uncharacterized protein n=1 Tax=Monilinia fructigena TaxID=38457 RepID=A0A395J5G3_9HELO|nr:hypothetical protein DID88_008455 [Monilinia fructigena]
MASASQPHSSFPARPYNNIRNPPPAAFGTQSQPALALRQKSQLERERLERERLSKDNHAQIQQPGAPPAAPMNILSDEQREEINEAVCFHRAQTPHCANQCWKIAEIA